MGWRNNILESQNTGKSINRRKLKLLERQFTYTRLKHVYRSLHSYTWHYIGFRLASKGEIAKQWPLSNLISYSTATQPARHVEPMYNYRRRTPHRMAGIILNWKSRTPWTLLNELGGTMFIAADASVPKCIHRRYFFKTWWNAECSRV